MWRWVGGAGFPYLGWEWQKTENVALCRALGMPPHLKGVRVTRTEPTATCARSLLPNDVVTAFDGTPIASDGTGGDCTPGLPREEERTWG